MADSCWALGASGIEEKLNCNDTKLVENRHHFNLWTPQRTAGNDAAVSFISNTDPWFLEYKKSFGAKAVVSRWMHRKIAQLDKDKLDVKHSPKHPIK